MSINYKGSFDFSQLRADLNDALPDALTDGGNVIADLSDTRVPVLTGAALKKANDQRRSDPGALLRSRYVRVEGLTQVAIGYSEFTAGWQEERLDYHHEQGQAKFLDSSLNDASEDAMDKVSERLSEAI